MRDTVRFFVVASLIVASAGARAVEPPLRVAAASDLQSIFATLTAAFEKTTGRTVSVSFGSSGNFFVQIQNGAPFDLFFSADAEYPKRLETSGLAVPGTRVTYANGQIVLWARNDRGLDLEGGLQILTDGRVRRVAIANPDHAPYGRAAVAALKHVQVYDAVRSKLVFGENVSQAAQFAQTGNADAGLVALSLARTAVMTASGRYVAIPQAYYPAIEQAAVVLRSSHDPEAARRFLAFVQSTDSRRLLQDAGFRLPQPGR